jgi:hypothetical protein
MELKGCKPKLMNVDLTLISLPMSINDKHNVILKSTQADFSSVFGVKYYISCY